MPRTTTAFTIVILAAVALSNVAAVAEPAPPGFQRGGAYIGFEYGAGGSGVEYERAGVKHERDEDTGVAVGLRIGYAFNPYVSLGIAARSYGHQNRDDRYTIGSTAIIATIYPAGGGFFLRSGIGGCTLETKLAEDADPNDPDLVDEFEVKGGLVALGLGYEWMATENFSLGFVLDVRGGAAEDFDEFENIVFAESTLGLTMNYFY